MLFANKVGTIVATNVVAIIYKKILIFLLFSKGCTLDKILISHWHPDHVGGTPQVLAQVADKNCKVFKYKNSKV